MTKLKRSQEGTSSLQKHGTRRSFFHSLQILTHIYLTSTILLVTIAILSIAHPHYHRFFLRVHYPIFQKVQKTSKSFWLVLKVLITQIMIHFLAAVSNGVASVINVKIILEEVKFFVAVLPRVFTILDNMLTVNLKT